MRHHLLVAVAVPLCAAGLSCQQPYGQPTPGSAGFAPRLSAAGAWIGNAGFGFDVQCAAGGAPGFLIVAGSPGALPLLGFELLLEPASLLGSLFFATSGNLPGQGAARVPFPLSFPATPNFLGWPFHTQALLVDAGAPGGTFAATQGLRCELSAAPLLFVACSIANNDPFQLVDPWSGTILDTGSPPEVDNATGAVFTDGGRRVFVASSIRGTIGMGDIGTLPVAWTTLFSGGGSCYGLAADPRRKLLWTLTNPGTGTRELTALDVDPQSPGFGTVRHNTIGVASGNYERWALSPSGRVAAILTYLPGSLTIVDTDDQSSTFLGRLQTALQIPVDQASALQLPTRVAITPDDRYVLVLIQHPGTMQGELARFDLLAGIWVDHNPAVPGQQNIGPMSSPAAALGSAPTSLEIAANGTFAVLSGFGGCGWVGRLDLDPKDPTYQLYTPWAVPSPLQNAWTAALSGDETEVALGIWQSNGCVSLASPELLRLSAANGAVLGTVALPLNSNAPHQQNLYTIVYR